LLKYKTENKTGTMLLKMPNNIAPVIFAIIIFSIFYCSKVSMIAVSSSGIAPNGRVYAMFATGIICRRLTSGKYG
jgi:hypothetical protein